MNIRAGFLGETDNVKLIQLGNLRANNLRVVDPHRAAKFGRQAQQVVGGQVCIGVVERAWHSELRLSFFMITPQPKENKKYRFIASLCKNDMDLLI